jgi:16S rRNA G966 N2-methylase RsmD
MNEAEFIEANKQKPVAGLALLLSKKPELDSTFILAQINGIQKAKNKLPEFYNNPNIVYPTKLSMEQCSSERTGIYKSSLFRHSGLDPESSIIDLTGGFGIDSFYFSKQFEQVTYIEQNIELFDVVSQNFEKLKASNIELINATAEDFLENTNKKVDVVYIDPSRRNENQRVFKLDECTPNIIELAPAIFKIVDKILVKTAPLLDIKQSLKDLKYVSKVWVISVENDCKEVLYLLEKNTDTEPQIHTINLTKKNQEFNFDFEQEQHANTSFSEPQNYLYEPNSSILKAGAFNSIAKKYEVKKLSPNTHLYTSDELIQNFPGRTFKIEQILPYSTKEFKKLRIKKANISCRNFKEKPEMVKKKLKLQDGGSTYIFATTDLNGKPILIVCVK